MRVACVLMQKNEVNALEPWLLYHAHLFGMENLCVIDHFSTHPKILNTLSWYEHEGLQVVRLPPEADYQRKGEFVTAQLTRLDKTGNYDFLMPLDCDEFLALRRDDGGFTCNRAEIHACLASYAGRAETLEVKQNLLNILGHPGRFWVFPYQKVFFSAGHVGVVDHGSHTDVLGRGNGLLETPLVYLHFHHKSWEEQVKAGKEKLRPFVDVDDPQALEAFKGIGWHLLVHMNAGEDSYTSMMNAAPGKPEVEGLLELFAALNINPLFFQKPVPDFHFA
ncbi:MAG: glycosyltransferase family 2 protein [Rhodospirillales bacterium]|nr:glycosyltransferase family 2 protein [Rhodospirillales bacterium]